MANLPYNPLTLEPEPIPVDPYDTDDAGLVYPVPEHKHLGVSTNSGHSADSMDQGDEEVTRETTGIPD